MPCNLFRTIEDIPRELESFEQLVQMFTDCGSVSRIDHVNDVIIFYFGDDDVLLFSDQFSDTTLRIYARWTQRETSEERRSSIPAEIAWERITPHHDMFHLANVIFTDSGDMNPLSQYKRTSTVCWGFSRESGMLTHKTETFFHLQQDSRGYKETVTYRYRDVVKNVPICSLVISCEGRNGCHTVRTPLVFGITEEAYRREAGKEIADKFWRAESQQ